MNEARGSKGDSAVRTLRIFALIGTALLLQACIFAPGSGDWRDERPSPREQTPTLGQELIDLDRARAAGAISEAEYQRLKANIIDND